MKMSKVRNLKSFLHHLLRTKNPKYRFLDKYHLRLVVNASVFRLTPRYRDPNLRPKATWYSSANGLKSSHAEARTCPRPRLSAYSLLHTTLSTWVALPHLTERQDSGQKLGPYSPVRGLNCCSANSQTCDLESYVTALSPRFCIYEIRMGQMIAAQSDGEVRFIMNGLMLVMA